MDNKDKKAAVERYAEDLICSVFEVGGVIFRANAAVLCLIVGGLLLAESMNRPLETPWGYKVCAVVCLLMFAGYVSVPFVRAIRSHLRRRSNVRTIDVAGPAPASEHIVDLSASARKD